MSAALKRIVQTLGKWPEDTLPRYASFKGMQTERVEGLLKSSNQPPSINVQADALDALLKNVNKDKFPVTSRLTAPLGNKTYYARLMEEASPNRKKTPYFKALFELLSR